MNTRNLMIALFAIAVIAQLAVPGWLLARHETVLRNGEAYRFECMPVDPVDLLRGRFVALRFSEMQADGIPDLDHGIDELFVTFETGEDGFAQVAGAFADPPEDSPHLKIGKYAWRSLANGEIHIDLPFDRFYMDENVAPEAEAAMRRRGRGAREAYLEVRILDGRAVPVELYINGKPASELRGQLN
ncbi:MAG: GDYXXLXY domain-containing protein [Acidobacteriota bacterium]|nr:GDYXXLXY domain-containing protein [Acidobacteriota bacterium]MDH3783708.1 GDYXXLXY domain-containing protein [Acidobacteriota bacterium]